jgi:hypothetical protein
VPAEEPGCAQRNDPNRENAAANRGFDNRFHYSTTLIALRLFIRVIPASRIVSPSTDNQQSRNSGQAMEGPVRS